MGNGYRLGEVIIEFKILAFGMLQERATVHSYGHQSADQCISFGIVGKHQALGTLECQSSLCPNCPRGMQYLDDG